MNWKLGFIVAAWFLIGAVVSYFVGNWDVDSWSIVAAIATWLLVLGVVFAIRQIEQARLSTNAQIAVQTFTKIRDLEIKKLLRDIIYELTPEKIEHLSATEKMAIGDLLDWFDMVGALIDRGIIDEGCAIESYGGGPAVLRCWYQLAAYIRNEQDIRGSYAENYESFAYRTYKHYKNSYTRIALSTKNIDNLLDEYDKSEFKTFFPRSSKIIRKQRRNKRGV